MTTATNTPLQKTLEERLQPWLDQAEYLIILTLAIMVWAGGWVDLLGFKSDTNTVILGRYSLPYFALLVAYTLGFAFWGWLIISLRALERMKRFIHFFQRQPLLFLLAWGAFAVVIWSMLGGNLWRYNLSSLWGTFRLLEMSILVLILLFSGMVLLTTPVANAPFQRWRKAVLAGIALVIGAEVVLQGLSYAGVLRVDNVSGVTVPYGRVYQQTEGMGNGFTNRYGWYYPEFRLADGTRRIIINGDTFIEALQIPKTAHLGVQLETLINASTPPVATEVLAQGHMGYGATQFMNWRFYSHIWEQFQPEEIVVFFHLANDFQTNLDEPGELPRVGIDENGLAEIIPEDFDYWHTVSDVSVQGHSAPDPLRILVSQSMLLNTLARDVIDSYLRLNLDYPVFAMNIDQVTDENPFGVASFVYEREANPTAEGSFRIAGALIKTFAEFLETNNVRLRLVTIPYFPASFYANDPATRGQALIGDYDLLQPERRLAEMAAVNGVDFLGMTQVLLDSERTLEELQALYFANGAGHLTEAGHRTFAEAVYACFYDPAQPLAGSTSCQRAEAN